MQPFVRTIHPQGILSFAPDSEPIPLTPLNGLIGPNGSGKSNLIEVFELLKALPTDLPAAIREGGGIGEWFWKGKGRGTATINADLLVPGAGTLRYGLSFAAPGQTLEIRNETVEDEDRTYYRFNIGHRATIVSRKGSRAEQRYIEADLRQSVLSQRKEPDLYPELAALGRSFTGILAFGDWSLGPHSPSRQPQPVDLPNDLLLPDASNLGLILNTLEQSDAWSRFSSALRRFLPRFKRLTTSVQGGTIQIFLHEEGLRAPIPARRLSDGTLRFIALLAILLRPGFAPLICLEEPELGLHPDALALIAELLVEASQQRQIIVTTQSEALVSALGEHTESVVVCDHLAGASRFRRLDSAKLRFWMEKYQLGEIWRAGELGGNP